MILMSGKWELWFSTGEWVDGMREASLTLVYDEVKVKELVIRADALFSDNALLSMLLWKMNEEVDDLFEKAKMKEEWEES